LKEYKAQQQQVQSQPVAPTQAQQAQQPNLMVQ